jgi:ribose 5-phosphate isomerase
MGGGHHNNEKLVDALALHNLIIITLSKTGQQSLKRNHSLFVQQ